MKWRTAILLVLGMLPCAGLHATETTVLRVTARVVEFCDVATTDLTLDNRAAQSGTPRLRATCTPNTTYLVGVTKRGATTGMTTVTGVGTGEPVDHTLFGGVPAAQVVPPAGFGDSVSVRVYY